MPQVMLEYTNRLEERANIPYLLTELHQVVIDSGLFEPDFIKTRAVRINHWLIGACSDDEDFIHVTIEMLEGRSLEQKQRLSASVAALIESRLDSMMSITVNIREMDKSCFQNIHRLHHKA